MDSQRTLVEEWLKEAKNGYEILPRYKDRAQSELLGLQVILHARRWERLYTAAAVS